MIRVKKYEVMLNILTRCGVSKFVVTGSQRYVKAQRGSKDVQREMLAGRLDERDHEMNIDLLTPHHHCVGDHSANLNLYLDIY